MKRIGGLLITASVRTCPPVAVEAGKPLPY
jgi:hypothetical protein